MWNHRDLVLVLWRSCTPERCSSGSEKLHGGHTLVTVELVCVYCAFGDLGIIELELQPSSSLSCLVVGVLVSDLCAYYGVVVLCFMWVCGGGQVLGCECCGW